MQVAGQNEPWEVFHGPFLLIAGGNWCLADTDNIRPKSLAPRALNEVVALLLDAGTDLWYEM